MILWIQNLGRAQLVDSSAPSAVGWGHSLRWFNCPRTGLNHPRRPYSCVWHFRAPSHGFSPTLLSLPFLLPLLSSLLSLYMSSSLIQQSYPRFCTAWWLNSPEGGNCQSSQRLGPRLAQSHFCYTLLVKASLKAIPASRREETEFVPIGGGDEWMAAIFRNYLHTFWEIS